MNVNGDIVDGGSNGEVLGDGIIEEQEFGRDAGEGDRVMNEGDKFSTTRVTSTVLTDSGVVWQGVC